MGPQPIEIPDYFTVSYYRQQKEAKKTDQEIANELLISYALLAKWKRQIGWTPGAGRKYAGRKKENSREEVLVLRKSGLTFKAIAETLGIHENSVYLIANELGLTKRAIGG